ncbi:major facilitator superfamily MFS_1 [Kribbella flavida DSM 17836]|uniref:Major facilitator superfamily MFS_1 n=1 Tax=Kribbella flavida (strain DSM 17836 / JCM 10339 / NBRC 14399) TaxID=479435 RepID=D2PPV8_KRIFD|nr:MFS transporter [Kribbella flavida]ADB32882.1 major facilitator superfamily MFS_1 [Kribbella flavida DSM 17836]
MTVTVGDRATRALPKPVWWLAAAWTLASTADNFLLFVILWIAGPQGWSGAETALLVVAIRIPALFGGVLGGRAVDRFGPVPTMVLDGAVRAALMGVLVVAGWSGRFPLWVMLVLGAAAGVTAPLSFAAARTLVPRLVDVASLGRANALLSVGDQLPMLVGAALAGPALALLGPGPAFVVPMVMLAMVAVIAARLPRRTAAAVEVARPGEPPRRWSSPRVAGLMALSVVYYLVYGPFETVLPYFAREQLGVSVGGYSLLWVVFGVASLMTLPLAPLLARRRPGLVNGLGAVVWGVVTVPLVLTESLPAAMLVFVVSGAIWGPYSAVEATALQRWTDPAVHGRVFGTQRAMLAIAAPLGAAVGALANDHFGPAVILGTSAVACTLAGLVSLPLLAKADRSGR